MATLHAFEDDVNDEDVIKAAVAQNSRALFASPEQKKNRDFVSISVTQNGDSDELRNGGLKSYIDELVTLCKHFYLFLNAALDRTKQTEAAKRCHTLQNSTSKLLLEPPESSLTTIADFLGVPYGRRYRRLLNVDTIRN
jgi:hypothetical protein